MDDIMAEANQIVRNKEMKDDMVRIINDYPEDIRDIVVIFITDKWEVDAYWRYLSKDKMHKVLVNVDKGINK